MLAIFELDEGHNVTGNSYNTGYSIGYRDTRVMKKTLIRVHERKGRQVKMRVEGWRCGDSRLYNVRVVVGTIVYISVSKTPEIFCIR